MASTSNGDSSDPFLVDPSLLEGLTEEQKEEAQRVAAAAARAEERAEQRALERAMEQKRQQRLTEKMQQEEAARRAMPQTSSLKFGGRIGQVSNNNGGSTFGGTGGGVGGTIQFVSKRKRADHIITTTTTTTNSSSNNDEEGELAASTNPQSNAPMSTSTTIGKKGSGLASSSSSSAAAAGLTERERQAIRQTYLGTTADSVAKYQQERQLIEKKNKKKSKLGKKTIFRFEWDNTDDTLQDDDYLYAGSLNIQKRNGNGQNNVDRKTADSRFENDRRMKRRKASAASAAFAADINSKPLDQMTARDWRIMRENYEIVVKGGRAPPPLRSFEDGNLLHSSLLKALTQVMRYSEPSPIQRQAIPIGLQRRDLIGIAETGSGKTAAFGIPLIQYILQLPSEFTTQQRVADHGPLALVVAPTRELALQIHGELEKLLTFCPQIDCCPIVGGQNLQQQSVRLRRGTHIVVGTPGRLNECLEMAYMVLNQCLYLVMDEGDRMIDMVSD